MAGHSPGPGRLCGKHLEARGGEPQHPVSGKAGPPAVSSLLSWQWQASLGGASPALGPLSLLHQVQGKGQGTLHALISVPRVSGSF